MPDLRYIAERWISQYGPETPQIIGQWAAEMEGAPTAAQLLIEIADVARALLAGHADRPRTGSGG